MTTAKIEKLVEQIRTETQQLKDLAKPKYAEPAKGAQDVVQNPNTQAKSAEAATNPPPPLPAIETENGGNLPKASWSSSTQNTNSNNADAWSRFAQNDAGKGMQSSETAEATLRSGNMDPNATQGSKAMTASNDAVGKALDYFGNNFDSAEYVETVARDEAILESWDATIKNQKKGQRLQQLFFMLGKMLESTGDLNVARQFIGVLTHIILGSKAEQTKKAGEQMIKLTQLQRQWTDKLINHNTDPNDANSGNDLMKLHTQVKAEIDAIGHAVKTMTSIAEELVHEGETMFNMYKSLSDVTFRINRRLSTFGQ